MFRYNWQIRDEWLGWCGQLSVKELLRKRTGGPGGILYTLFHVADVEYSWIRAIQGKPDVQPTFDSYATPDRIRALSESWRSEIEPFIRDWKIEFEHERVSVSWTGGRYSQGEILRHLIAHEIHHVGQLSVWARELGLQPVSANLIGRSL